MAEDRPEWPETVIKKDDLKSMQLILTLEGMEVIKPFYGPNKPKNFKVCKEEFLTGEVTLQYEVITSDSQTKMYEYTKKLPADIVPEKCFVKYKKDELVAVTLWKAKEASWGQYARYMAMQNQDKK